MWGGEPGLVLLATRTMLALPGSFRVWVTVIAWRLLWFLWAAIWVLKTVHTGRRRKKGEIVRPARVFIPTGLHPISPTRSQILMIVDFQAVYLTGRLVRFKRGRGSSLNDDEAPLTPPQSISGSFQLVFLHFSLCFRWNCWWKHNTVWLAIKRPNRWAR